MSAETIAALAALLEKAGLTPQQLVENAARRTPTPTNPTPNPTIEEPTMTGITVKGVHVPAPTTNLKITQDVKKAYNSALSRVGLPTLGVGGASLDNLKARYAELATYAGTPAETKKAKPTTPADPTAALVAALSATLGLTPPAKESTAEPGTLRHHISTYIPKDKTRVWVKRTGERVPCTEEQYALWSKRRAERELREAQQATVTPVIPTNVDTEALAGLLKQLLNL